MKILRFVFFFSITLALFIVLNMPLAGAPPLGKLLSPHQGFWQNAEVNALELPDNIRLSGLKEDVTIQFDEMYIPHIYANNLEDLYFAQGYITAYHRLWQMDFNSRFVLGRLSEVVGDVALDLDRTSRRTGLTKMTQDFHDTLMKDKKVKSIIDSYTAGVNAYIEKLSPADYPIEFKLLNYAPEKWTTVKSSVVYALLANTLSRSEADLQNTNFVSLFGKDMHDILFPDQLSNLDPIFPEDMEWDFEPIQVEKPDVDYPTSSISDLLERPDRIFGSNNFAVDGNKSKSGNPLLANEPDLELTQPSIWYATHLNAPGINVMGATVPGTAPILVGFNDRIAWGVTNSPRDQVDWYEITFKDETRKEYLYNGKWFKTEIVVEEFKIRDESSFYDTMVYVHYGPIVYDRNFRGNEEKINYAMDWIAHDEVTTLKAMLDLNYSQNIDEFNEALSYFGGPPQNFVFASIDGDIAMRAPGKFPVKWEGQGKYLMDGSDPRFEWKDVIPYEQQMFMQNPERGFVSSANQHQVSPDYPYWVYDDYLEVYRNRRINDRLKTLAAVTPDDMMGLQNDNFNYKASEILPAMLDTLDTAGFGTNEWEIYNSLVEWDFFSEPELEAPIYFKVWWNRLYRLTWDEFDTVSVDINYPYSYTTIHLLKNQPDFPFFDRLGTDAVENAISLYQQSFDAAVDSVAAWKDANPGKPFQWYAFKNTRITHRTGISSFGLDQVKIGGDGGIVNAAGSTAGPSWRMVVELDPNQVKAWAVYPGSQSGNPGNPKYGHMIEDWAAGKYTQLKFSNGKLTDGVVHTLTLQNK